MSVDLQSTLSGRNPSAAEDDLVGLDGSLLATSRPRSDPRDRRGWLCFLDVVLADEVRWAGAISCEELIALDHPLKRRASAETIREWWEYAKRRGWLGLEQEQDADRFQLTDRARADLQARHDYVWQTNPFEWAKGIAKWALPAGAIGAAGYVAGKAGVTALAILAVCVALAVGLFIAGIIMRWLDRPLDRWAARRACAWLDGKPVPGSRKWSSDVQGEFVRLYAFPLPDRTASDPVS